jgi:hypothetical protein
MPASTTRIGVVIDDLIDLIVGPQLTTRSLMPGLPTRLAALPLAPRELLGLRARLRPPLRPCLRRILRRRHRARPRVLARLLLESLQAILMLRKPAREIENELDTRLSPAS